MDKVLSVNAHCDYNGEPGELRAYGCFVMLFSDYLVHPSSGGYGKRACMDLQAIDDMLRISINYEHTRVEYDDYYYERQITQCYNLVGYMDFTPNNQMHYAESKCIDTISKSNTTLLYPSVTMTLMDELLEDMSIASIHLKARKEEYDAYFDIEHDDSTITYNGRHCTIAEYIAAYFDLTPYSTTEANRNSFISDYMRQKANEKSEARKKEIEAFHRSLWG